MINFFNKFKKVGSIDASKWVKNHPDLSQEYLIYANETVQYKKTACVNINESLSDTYQEKIPDFYLRTIEKGKCYTQNGIVISPDNIPFNDYSVEINHPLRKKRAYKFDNPIKIDENIASLSVDPLNLNYFHWMIESFPRLSLIQQADIIPDKYIICNELPFQKFLLSLIGIEESRIINNTPNVLIQAKNLIVPDMLNNFELVKTEYGQYYNTKYFPTWIAEFYRSLVLPYIQKTQQKRIYISRKDSRHRKIVNTKALEELLEKFGFKKYFLEDMDFLEQAQLFYNAEFVIAPHGAGLVNQIFCPQDVKIIEIFSGKYLCNSLQIISLALNYHYNYLIADSVENDQSKGGLLLYEDIKVNLDEIEKMLNTMGL